MARQKSLDDIEKRIEQLKQEKEKVINDMALTFAKKVIKDEKISTKKELNDWYKKAKDALAFRAEYDKKLAEHEARKKKELEAQQKAQAEKRQAVQSEPTARKAPVTSQRATRNESVKTSDNGKDAELAKYGITI